MADEGIDLFTHSKMHIYMQITMEERTQSYPASRSSYARC